MNKLDFQSPEMTLISDFVSQSDPYPVRRLIVLIPADTDTTLMTRRIWELANAMGRHVRLLGLCKDAAQEPGLHRELVTMSALIQDRKVSVEARVEIGTNWVDAVKRNHQAGDMIVCFAEQQAGLLHRPLSQILESRLDVPVYILSGLYPQKPARPNQFSQFLAWTGSFGLIVGSFVLQSRIVLMPKDWAQSTLLILSVIFEAWLIWAWNSLLD